MTGPVCDPIAEFGEHFARARGASEPGDATACALATATPNGEPAVRMVLLKHFDDAGFVFYTNYESRKAGELDANPRGALCFHWVSTGVQVRLEGSVERVGVEESDAYFATRGRLSRLGAWASRQSRPLESRAELVRRVAQAGLRYPIGSVPRPPFWGGYRLVPKRIEFWLDRAHRLHDRRECTRGPDGWRMTRLYP